MYLFVWNGIFIVVTLGGLRKNLSFTVLMVLLDIAVFFIAAMFTVKASAFTVDGSTSNSLSVLLGKIGGACMFSSALAGWWAVVGLFLMAGGWPFELPQGDTTEYWARWDQRFISRYHRKRN